MGKMDCKTLRSHEFLLSMDLSPNEANNLNIQKENNLTRQLFMYNNFNEDTDDILDKFTDYPVTFR